MNGTEAHILFVPNSGSNHEISDFFPSNTESNEDCIVFLTMLNINKTFICLFFLFTVFSYFDVVNFFVLYSFFNCPRYDDQLYPAANPLIGRF